MPTLLQSVILLLAAALVIYLACELFVNGVEWLGVRLSVGQKATGSVLAAFGTALPESVVTLVAVAFGGTVHAKALGVGAALGGPLALATIGYATVGLGMLAFGRRLEATAATREDFRQLARDQGWFLGLFVVKIALGLVLFRWKPWLGLIFLAAYGLYLRKEMASGREMDGAPEPLLLARSHATPPLATILIQTGLALTAIFVASRLFVDQLGLLTPLLGVRPELVALLLSPIATELPETMNAIIWIRQGKHRLALANISGAMMIQTTVPTAFALFWTPWHLDEPLLLAAGTTAVAILVMIMAFRRGIASRRLLAAMALFYLTFIVLLVGFGLVR
ncbi:sodium:calcium antiporter [Sphingomonas sp.]|uniref:sodium:calcium antiporter n=1 Tax=Sphingomonas sp. TaxID=28214 RepID=UPI003B3A05E3